jgi:hypothetical protein
VDHSWPIENNLHCLWAIQKDLYCLQATKMIFTIDDYLLLFSKGSKTISMGMGNYKTICTNHGQLKTIYTIDALLLFIPK